MELFVLPLHSPVYSRVPKHVVDLDWRCSSLLSVRFPFLSHGQQNLAEADPGRPYIMQAEQARELRDALSRALERIENYAIESPSAPLSPSSLSIY